MKTIIQEVPEGESRYIFTVEKGNDLTILLLALKKHNATVEAFVRLAGKGAKATIVGVIVAGDSSTMKLHTFQQHEAPETTSNLLVKAVVHDRATFNYDGGIRVEKKAQKTDAYQRNENLLLSDTAHAESKPSLEILANDVRCTHGATVGQIPEDQLWYLATRGIGIKKGQRLIVSGFLESALEAVSDTTSLEAIKNRIAASLA